MDGLGDGRGPSWDRHRQAIPATCELHRGPMGFANLMVSRREAGIVLDPHVTGGMCLITLDEDAARTLRDILVDWFGQPRSRRCARTPDSLPEAHHVQEGEGAGDGLA